VDDENMTIYIDELVLDAGDSLTTGLRERLGAVLAPADLAPVSRAVAGEVQRRAGGAALALPRERS
jgi:hypothetical protein